MPRSSNGNIFGVTGPLCGEFTDDSPSERQVTRSFDVFFDLRLNERLSKQSWGWWFETPSRPLWRHANGASHLEWYLISKIQIEIINSLTHWRFEWNYRQVIFNLILLIDEWGISWGIVLRWMSLNRKSILMQIMACYLTPQSHYLGQCWPLFMTPYFVTRPQGINGQRKS